MSAGPGTLPIRRLQAADKALGALACALLWPLRAWGAWGSLARPSERVQRVLAIKFWGIGSLQLLVPAARSLRRRHPEAELVLLTLAENADFARGLGVWDRVVTVDVRVGGWASLAGRILGLLARLRRERPDEVYDFEFFTRFSAVVSWVCGAPVRHGYHASSVWRGGLHTRRIAFNRYWHVARNFRALAGGEDGADVDPGELSPYRVGPREERAVAGCLAAAGLSRSPIAVLNPNAGRLSLERRWPAERFAALARRLVLEEGLAVVLVGTADERAHTALVARVARDAGLPPEHVLDLSGRLGVGELCALLARARVLVSNDSGPMHLGAALGTPTLGLFGPETPVMYRPLGERARALWRPPICSPCINVHDNKRATCVHGRPECLMALSVDEVLWSVRGLLAEGRSGASRRAAPAPSEAAI